MKTLYLHIGHSKTGSSWLQQLLFINRKNLMEQGIQYWFSEPELNDPDYPTNIHWGNAKYVFSSPEQLEAYFNALPEATTSLLSAEEIFYDLMFWRRIDFPINFLRSKGYQRIRILLFIRNPMEQLYSNWAEELKNDWFPYHKPLDEYITDQFKPALVAEFIQKMSAIPEIELTIRNYSNCSKRLDQELYTWLDIPHISPAKPDKKIINRSLTHSEILILRTLKAAGYPDIWPMTELMMSFSPTYPIQKFYPKQSIQQAFFDRFQKTIEYVNACIPAAHTYATDIKEYVDPEQREVRIDKTELDAICQKLSVATIQHDESLLQYSEEGLIEQIQQFVREIPDKSAFRNTEPRTLFIHTHRSQPGGESAALFECPELFAPYSDIVTLMPVSKQHHTNTHFVICTRLTQNLLDSRETDPLKIQSDLFHMRNFGYSRIYVCWPESPIPDVLADLAPTVQTVHCPRRKQSISDLFKKLLSFLSQKIRA